MKLLDLPTDIIILLPQHFNSIYDLYNVLFTCKTLYTAYRDKVIKLPPIIPKPDGQYLLQPHPRLLLTSVARQIGNWAVSSASNRYELYQSLLEGYDGLLSLAQQITRVSLSDLRNLHDTKYSLLNPLARLVDFEVGPAMVRNQDMDPDDYGLTICLAPDLAVMNFVVYSELFHHYADDIISLSNAPDRRRPLEAGIRQRFIAYCLPDTNNHRNRHYKTLGKKGHKDEWQLLDYIQVSQSDAVNRCNEALRRFWLSGNLQAIPEDEHVALDGHALDWQPTIPEKREYLFITVASHLGWDSLRMLMLDGFANPQLQVKLGHIRHRVQTLHTERVRQWQYWSQDDDESHETSPIAWSTWLGLASDCHDGIRTNNVTDEDLRTEEDLCEGLLKMAMETEDTEMATNA